MAAQAASTAARASGGTFAARASLKTTVTSFSAIPKLRAPPVKRPSRTSVARATRIFGMSPTALATMTSGAFALWSRLQPKASAFFWRHASKIPAPAASQFWKKTSAPAAAWASAFSLASATSSQLPRYSSRILTSGRTERAPAAKAAAACWTGSYFSPCSDERTFDFVRRAARTPSA